MICGTFLTLFCALTWNCAYVQRFSMKPEKVHNIAAHTLALSADIVVFFIQPIFGIQHYFYLHQKVFGTVV